MGVGNIMKIQKHIIYLILGFVIMLAQIYFGFNNNEYKVIAKYSGYLSMSISLIAIILSMTKKLTFVPYLLVISFLIGVVSVVLKLL